MDLQPPAKAPAWRSRPELRFATVFFCFLAATFPLALAGITAFAYGDAGQFAYPVAFYARDSLWRGEIPLWNPLSSCGIPFLAQWNTMVLYPLSAIHFLLPMPWSFGVFCLLHMVIAAVGMFKLGLRGTGSAFAAGCAGMVYGFNGFTWYGIMWPHLLSALAWTPWLVLLMDRYYLAGGSCGRVFAPRCSPLCNC